MHNDLIEASATIKHDLVLAVDPALYPLIQGSTGWEVFFFLALTFGLEADPVAAVARAAGFIERAGRGHGIAHPIKMTVATSDGRSIWAFRYSSVGASRSHFYSTRVDALRALCPDNPVFRSLSE